MGRNKSQVPRRRPVDTTGIITIIERDQIIALIEDIVEKMGNQFSNIFHSPPPTPTPSGYPSQDEDNDGIHVAARGNYNKILAGKDSILFKINKQRMYTDSTIIVTTKPYAKAYEMLQKEETQALSPQLAELQKEVRAIFGKWQTQVLSRAKEIEVKEPQSQHSILSARGGKGKNPCARGSARGRGGPEAQIPSAPVPVVTARPPLLSQVDPALRSQYRPTGTSLWYLSLEKRRLILHIMFLLLLSLEEYTSHTRMLLLNMTSSLHLPLRTFQDEEARIARAINMAILVLPLEDYTDKPDDQSSDQGLDQKLDNQQVEEPGEPRELRLQRKPRESRSLQNAAKMAGMLIGPLMAAGVGSVPGGLRLNRNAVISLMGPALETKACIGGFFGIFGGMGPNGPRPMSKSMEQFAKDVQDFALVPLHGYLKTEYLDAKDVMSQDRRMRLVVGISGWTLEDDDITNAWACLGNQAEVYALRWELASLMNLGNSLETVIKSNAWGAAKKDIISRSIVGSIVQALWPLSLLKISKIIDNSWNIGMVRAEKAGLTLAEAIIRRVQGSRPVSLIGYSLGARVIYACLMILAERRQLNLVDSVIMIGTPAPSETRVWLTLKSVVAGRLINVYSESDYLLAFLYRTSNVHFGLAGIEAIRGVDGVENHHVGNLGHCSHLRYRYMISGILNDLGWEDLDVTQAARNAEALVVAEDKYDMEKKRRQLITIEAEVMCVEEVIEQKTRTRKRRRGKRGGKSKIQQN